MVTNLADALATLGHKILITYLTGEALVLPRHPDVRIEPLRAHSPLSMLAAYFRLRRILKDFKPDVVHSHLVHANILARLMRLSLPIPRLISSAHNTNEEGRIRMLAYRLTDRLADISTNVSDEATAAFIAQKAVAQGRMVTVHNGISTQEFAFDPMAREQLRGELGIAPETHLIVAVGRINVQKDYPNLLAALSQLDVGTLNYQVCVAGSGPLQQHVQELAQTLQISDRIRFLGARCDIPRLMSAADLFVLSSAWEGFGLVVAEAMACERLVVATDCGGVREVLGEHGFLVPPRQPEALAYALAQALRLPAKERAACGHRARRRIEQHYSLDTAVSKWLTLYGAKPSFVATATQSV